MDQLEPIPLPVELPMWTLADFAALRDELHARLGPPHHVDPEGNGWGIEHVWGFTLRATGQRLLVQLCLPHGMDLRREPGMALLHADPPNLEPVLSALGIEPTDSRLRTFPPVPQR